MDSRSKSGKRRGNHGWNDSSKSFNLNYLLTFYSQPCRNAPRRNSFTIMTCSVLRTRARRRARRSARRPHSRGEERRRGRLVADSARLGSPGYAMRFQSKAIEARLARLPEGVSVEPDRLEVQFTGAKEAVVRLFAMAQALTRRAPTPTEPVSPSPRRLPLTSSEPAAPCYAGGR